MVTAFNMSVGRMGLKSSRTMKWPERVFSARARIEGKVTPATGWG
ncbi:MAG: hypothetical protein V3S39_08045 [Thermodesulfobacteriota bacterium]